MDNPTIDEGVCTACNCTVTYDETSQDDEVCIRSKPYCTKPDDEHVDWRATCKHVERCLVEMKAARDAACDALDEIGSQGGRHGWASDRARRFRRVGEP